MLSVEDALSLVLANVQRTFPITVALEVALGHILAADAVSSLAIPPFDNSAMDGFAVRTSDLACASPTSPVLLPLRGEVRAGDPPSLLPEGPACLRIMTGAPIPDGADAVVMKEETSEVEGCLIQFSSTPRPQENIRPRGDDIASEQMAVAAGTLLRPAEVSLLAAIGRSRIDVVPRPRVAVFTTGDEVVPVHGPLLPGQIYNSNQYLLNGLVADAGAKRVWTEHLPDDPEVTAARLEEASRWADAIVTCGGVSMGEHDHIRGAVERLGAVVFWRVSMKPGKPILFGLVAGRPIFGMPGNPVSAMVGFEIFVRPALLHMAGHSALQRPRVRARLLAPISHRPGRQEYVRTLTTIRNDEFVSEPYPGQGSHLIRSMTHANSLAIVPTGTGCLAVGDFVEVMMTQWPEW